FISCVFFFSSRRRHTRSDRDWSSDVCSSDLYFDPWIAGVVMPTLIIIGLMVIPYIDTNPLGSGYYTWKQRKFAISTFLFGFVILWVSMIFIGTFIRGPGWQWFWPGQTWDHNRLIYEVNRDLPDLLGLTSNLWKGIF